VISVDSQLEQLKPEKKIRIVLIVCCTACKALTMTLFLYILWCFGRDKREEARQESKPGKVGPF
jgi:hypothetical protein